MKLTLFISRMALVLLFFSCSEQQTDLNSAVVEEAVQPEVINQQEEQVVKNATLESSGSGGLFKERGNSLENLIPGGWKLLSSAVGDLNNDGIKDLAFVVQNTDARNYEFDEEMGADTVDLNPRILGIYFGNTSGTYEKQAQADNFILLRDSPVMDEPFEGLKITGKGILQIAFNLWYSAGSWTMSNHIYKFRYKNNGFELIGYDSNVTDRSSGETTDLSINFPGRKMRIAKGNIEDDKQTAVEWREFKLESLKTIESLKKPFEWEFEDTYL